MKKLGGFLALIFASCAIMNAQTAKKPTLMIVPSDNWCQQRYFVTTYNDQGSIVSVPDYKAAFQQDTEIGGVISLIGQMMTDLGYSLKDCEQELKAINQRQAEDNVTESKSNAAMLTESSLDILKRRTKSDIIIQIGWQLSKAGAGKALTFTLEAFDAYSSKRIATATGTQETSGNSVPVMLENAVKSQIKQFDNQLMKHFKGMGTNGREIVLTVRTWDNWDNDLESEFGGEELIDCIQNWLQENAVQGSFNLTDQSENFAQFEQVMIPLFNERGAAVDARAFATNLRKHLQNQYGITSKVMVRGLGEAVLVLGEK